jgi:hypothetical protein
MPRHVARLITRLVAPLVVDYFDYATRSGASAPRAARRVAHRAARRRLLRLRHPFGCLGTSRGLSHGSSRHSSSTTRLHRASGCLGTSRGLSRCSSSTSSPTPCVRVPWHLARLVTRLIVEYFDYATHSGASAPRTARHAARRAARHAAPRAAGHRLLRLRRASRCLGTLRGTSSTTSPTMCVRVPWHLARLVARLVTRLVTLPVVDYFDYATRSGASAPRAARRVARCRLLRLRRAFGCRGTSRGSSCGASHRSSSTTSTTPRVRVPRHVTRLVASLVIWRTRFQNAREVWVE